MKFTIKGEHRPQGLYIAGNPGFGKSSLIQHLALVDIAANRGVCVIDPTGDLVTRLLNHIPKNRAKKTIYFDTDNPVPIDFFSYGNPAERQVLTDQLLDIFELESAPVSKPNLQKIFGTLFDANDYLDKNDPANEKDRCTFLDIRHFIQNKKRREEILDLAPKRKEDWEGEQFKPIDYNSITKRMTPFFEIPALKVMFGAKKPKLKISDVMRDNLILLVNIKDTPSDLDIASLITAKFQQATFGRRYIDERKRTPYYLYIDECHTILKYAAAQFETILTRARKFKLCLTLANQIPDDLPAEIQRKLGTIHTKVLFNLDEQDSRLFKSAIANRIPKPPEDNREKEEAHFRRILQRLEPIEYEIRFLQAQIAKGGQEEAEKYTTPQKLTRLLYDREQLTQQLRREIARESPDPPEPLDASMLQTLPKFTAIAITGDHVYKITTPQPLGYSSASYAKWIRKRTGENYSCALVPMPHTESIPTLSDDIPPQPKTAIPPNPHKKTGTRTSR